LFNIFRHPGVNTRFGNLAVPTILPFHSSKPVSKFNHSTFNPDNHAQFIGTLAGIEASEPLEVT
jgi:thioredoxin-like negative regulator of GroEL